MTCEEAGITVTGPASFWKWKETSAEDANALLALQCVNGMNEDEFPFIFEVHKPVLGDPITDRDARVFMTDFKDGMRRAVGANYPLARLSYEMTSTPAPGSLHFKGEIVSSGATAYFYGYVAQRSKLYFFADVSQSPQEPAAFKAFVASAQMTKVKEPPDVHKFLYAGVGVVVVVILAALFFQSHRKASGPPAVRQAPPTRARM